jgi:hypothetical protein
MTEGMRMRLLDERIQTKPTSFAFGKNVLDRLFVTSGKCDLPSYALAWACLHVGYLALISVLRA